MRFLLYDTTNQHLTSGAVAPTTYGSNISDRWTTLTTGWYSGQNAHACGVDYLRLTDRAAEKRGAAPRQKIRSDSGDLAIPECIDCNRHSLQHFEERGFSTTLVLLECRGLGFDRLFPDGVLLICSHQYRESVLLHRDSGRPRRVRNLRVTSTRRFGIIRRLTRWSGVLDTSIDVRLKLLNKGAMNTDPSAVEGDGDAHGKAKIYKDGPANGTCVKDVLRTIAFITQNLRVVNKVEKLIVARLPVPEDGCHLLGLVSLRA